mmetsp:Transcript_20230/g.62554  ORF Transcript_20230/g.62554 Transcript_20230/m.62554 type:complete len:252 (-) Transcript_20230:40-795(-)
MTLPIVSPSLDPPRRKCPASDRSFVPPSLPLLLRASPHRPSAQARQCRAYSSLADGANRESRSAMTAACRRRSRTTPTDVTTAVAWAASSKEPMAAASARNGVARASPSIVSRRPKQRVGIESHNASLKAESHVATPARQSRDVDVINAPRTAVACVATYSSGTVQRSAALNTLATAAAPEASAMPMDPTKALVSRTKAPRTPRSRLQRRNRLSSASCLWRRTGASSSKSNSSSSEGSPKYSESLIASSGF